jgi:adenosylcobinamide kinase/adenosylcobinamide-phosphate guanylyltransferase
MKVLFTGGQKSGKSTEAEKMAISLATSKPYYLATSEIMDRELERRVELHKKQREDRFITVEEPLNLSDTINSCDDVVLVECLTIWINNMLHYDKRDDIFSELEKVLSLKNDMVFVLNDVGLGIIPENKLAREFIDISGKVGQMVAASCDEVYYVTCGIRSQLK